MSGPNPVKRERPGLGRELLDGASYTFRHPVMRLILIHFALVSMLGTSFSVLLPVMARDILNGGPPLLGFLTGSLGCGALISALFLARRHETKGLDKLIGLSSVLFGLSLMLLALSRHTVLSLFSMVFTGMGMVAQMTTSNTYLQLSAQDDKRARVMAFYLLAFFASMPFGSLLTGTLAEIIGAPGTIFLCGLACLVSSLIFFLRLGGNRKSFIEQECRGFSSQ